MRWAIDRKQLILRPMLVNALVGISIWTDESRHADG
jgi:hypothetical protein